MEQLIDVDRYPICQIDSSEYRSLVKRFSAQLSRDGLINLAGFLTPHVLEQSVSELLPLIMTESFTHCREHNVFFDDVGGLDPDHPALKKLRTTSHTICADQLHSKLVTEIYESEEFVKFLAAIIGKPELYPMEDRLGRVNVMAYYEGEALNWHFDRSEFTITLLLQSPEYGGKFQVCKGLRDQAGFNLDEIGRMLAGNGGNVLTKQISAGSLTIFQGKYTAHRITPVLGNRPRIVAVFSYFEAPNVRFSEFEQIGFYGRVAQ